MAAVIHTEQLAKFYGRRRGLDSLDLEVGSGEIYGFLGPNGAGKTTTIRVLLDLIRPSGGRVEVFGLVPRDVGAALRRRIGFLPGSIRSRLEPRESPAIRKSRATAASATATLREMQNDFDFVVIGAGAAGEAAAYMARSRKSSVAVIDRELVGGSCSFWACMPSKSLLHNAGIHVLRSSHSWRQASNRRDWMINREKIDWPDDSSHVKSLEDAGAEVIRGAAYIEGPGRVRVTPPDEGTPRTLAAKHIVVAVGSNSTVPPIPGLHEVEPWTNREASSARKLPRSLAILGGGPTGIELAQVYARFGVPVSIVHSHERLNQRDHPRNTEAVRAGLERDGVKVLAPVRAERVVPAKSRTGDHEVELSDGTSVRGQHIMLSIGRTVPIDGLGLENAGVSLHDGSLPADGELRLADGLWVAGDPAGPEMHTHLAHYQGEMVVRMALGDEVKPDYRAIPRCVYTDPETAGVGLTLDEARDAGHDAQEFTTDLGKTAKGFVADATGHVTIVVDRKSRQLVGAFIAGPGASEAIHEAVLAIKTGTTIDVLADTLHAFPTTSRVLGTMFMEAAKA